MPSGKQIQKPNGSSLPGFSIEEKFLHSFVQSCGEFFYFDKKTLIFHEFSTFTLWRNLWRMWRSQLETFYFLFFLINGIQTTANTDCHKTVNDHLCGQQAAKPHAFPRGEGAPAGGG
jgi:hypothetical protein